MDTKLKNMMWGWFTRFVEFVSGLLGIFFIWKIILTCINTGLNFSLLYQTFGWSLKLVAGIFSSIIHYLMHTTTSDNNNKIDSEFKAYEYIMYRLNPTLYPSLTIKNNYIQISIKYQLTIKRLKRWRNAYVTDVRSKVWKLMATFERKENYIMHYMNLQQAINKGVPKILEFSQSDWLAKYIQLNTEMRTKVKNEFEKDFFKLMNNAIFGRFSVLDISKTLMHDYHYNVMRRHYGEHIKLMYTDTDSLVYHIMIDDFYIDLLENSNLMDRLDTADLPSNHPCYTTAQKMNLSFGLNWILSWILKGQPWTDVDKNFTYNFQWNSYTLVFCKLFWLFFYLYNPVIFMIV
ncbi:hypothetical protein AGLY_013842 [Aphis glycines]|uniref:DNA-directed DNA polymerase n=1 Tax=Aphis glycines TaxID=307491 RepID=A0A6G0T581_APHGL|nr:hypothetical protein AGLY_013842 [Aphis glycines]